MAKMCTVSRLESQFATLCLFHAPTCRGLFRKAHFLEVLENLEILEILENPQTVENKGEPDHFLDLENFFRDFRDSRDSSSEKTPFVMTPFFCPELLLGKRNHTPPCSSAELSLQKKKGVHRGKISVVDMVFLAFVRVFVSTTGLESFSLGPEKFSKRVSFGGGCVRFFLLCFGECALVPVFWCRRSSSSRTKRGIHKRYINEKVRFLHFLGHFIQ